MLPEKQTGEGIAQIWHHGYRYFSILDVVRSLDTGIDPHIYWAKMKRRLKREGASSTLAQCQQFRNINIDETIHGTEYVNTETLLRIIQSIPSPKAEPFKQWLAGLGADVIDDRTEDQRRLDYRVEGIDAKKRLHDEVHDRGVRTPKAHQEMEVRGHKKLYGGETPQDTRERKDIGDDDLGEWMGSEEIIDNSFRDAQSRAFIKRMDVQGREPVIKAHEDVSSAVRRFITEELGGTAPEELPTPTKSLTQVRKDEERRRTRGMDLFPEVDAPLDDTTE